MTPKRIAQLEQMLERGTIRKGHTAEMLDAIKQRKPLTDSEAYKAIKDWTSHIDPEDEPSRLDIFRAAEAAYSIREKNT